MFIAGEDCAIQSKAHSYCTKKNLSPFETRIYVSNLLELFYLFSFFFSGFNAIPGLSTMDYVTVAVIEKYLDFKVKTELLN